MSGYSIYWGESHDNTYQFAETVIPIEESMRRARSHLDFYAAAYYTAFASAFRAGGHLSETDKPVDLAQEGWKDDERLEREWTEVQQASRDMNEPGRFVTFPGYEWQGDGASGDHNVFFLREGAPIIKVDTLAELYSRLRELEIDAIAIPHHTGYRPGRRGRDWSVFDEELSPFAELYSIHGCSETDEEWIGLRHNSHMGPGQGGGTYQDALDRGYHVGAVCSTDNWGDMPGHYGNGRMAVLATELTREALWDAFKARRVYGVTGDRIELDFSIDEAVMGSIIDSSGPRFIRASVRGSDAIDRIELLRDGRVIATYTHQGRWSAPRLTPRSAAAGSAGAAAATGSATRDPGTSAGAGRKSRYKIRIEVGWGPRPNELEMENRRWDGTIRVSNGTIVGWEPCWITPGQTPPEIRGGEARFTLISSTSTLKERMQNSNVFEIEARPDDALTIELNGLEDSAPVADFASRSRVLWYREECVNILSERAGLPPESPERDDIYYHVAYKAKIHRAIPEAGYTAGLDFVDQAILDGEASYRIRVEQRNGQRAWSSPIWVRPRRA